MIEGVLVSLYVNKKAFILSSGKKENSPNSAIWRITLFIGFVLFATKFSLFLLSLSVQNTFDVTLL